MTTSRKPNYHVVPFGIKWAVQKNGSVKPLVITRTQQEAIKFAEDFADGKQVNIAIHSQNGRIRETRTCFISPINQQATI